ncbi:MAG TPA: alpha/beta hydrolase, partial [Candidatus Binatia bacterium]|nr:alpha/beta hydrolase [Candidatus Binatia bacterium]
MTPTSTPHFWLRRMVIACLLLGLFLGAAGAAYQWIESARDRRAAPMPGQLVDVGGYRMHIVCLGSGSPTVVFDSGLGDSFVPWYQKVQPRVAQFARACSYDRAGYGYSDASPRPRTSQDMAEELHRLLHNAGVEPPYLLVGHSLAGYNVRLFTQLYRGEVAGMVLVDASHPEQMRRFPPELNDMDASWRREMEFFAFTMPFGIPRLMGFCTGGVEARAADCNVHSLRESVAEMDKFPESAKQAAGTGPFGGLPLSVLSEDPDIPQPDLPEELVKPVGMAWSEMQEELTHLSTRGTRIVAKNSGHYIQLDRPDLVVEAVRQVLAQQSGTKAE